MRPDERGPAGGERANGRWAGDSPANGAPAGGDRADDGPANGRRTDDNPADGPPMSGDLTGNDPANGHRTDDRRANDNPVSGAPAGGGQVGEGPASDTPMSGGPAVNDPADDGRTNDSPANGGPTGGEQAGQGPASSTPVSGSPTSNDPASGHRADDGRTNDSPASGAPAGGDRMASGSVGRDSPMGSGPVHGGTMESRTRGDTPQRGGDTRSADGSPLRVTWAQPEDLLGHELRQAAQDGRDARGVERRWLAAGGHPAPARAGASSVPASPALRALAEELLDELAVLDSPLAPYEPTDLDAIKTVCPDWPDRPDAAGPARGGLAERLHAAWLGRAAGCLLGKPVEKLPLEGIRTLARATGNWPLTGYFTARGLDPDIAAAHPWNRRSATTSLAENIDGMPEDDDLNYPLLALLLLERHGPGFTTGDVARLWLDELPAGRTFTAERVAYRNLLAGIEPPHTGAYRNPFREWIGAQIRADVFGWTHPGDPAGAAEAAWRDAVLTHTANGVYGEMFTAAALARAAGGGPGVDVDACVAAGLAVVPPASRYATAVRTGVAAAREAAGTTPAGFERVVDGLHAAYGDHHWVHVLPNAALLAAALTHADGDFEGAIRRVVSGGWDTDSNGATAGSLTALLAGTPRALPARWTAPLRNRLATSVGGMNGIGFDELAARTAQLSITSAGGAAVSARTTSGGAGPGVPGPRSASSAAPTRTW